MHSTIINHMNCKFTDYWLHHMKDKTWKENQNCKWINKRINNVYTSGPRTSQRLTCEFLYKSSFTTRILIFVNYNKEQNRTAHATFTQKHNISLLAERRTCKKEKRGKITWKCLASAAHQTLLWILSRMVCFPFLKAIWRQQKRLGSSWMLQILL